jgi:hypothetical protein
MPLAIGPTEWWIRIQPPVELGLQNFLFDDYFYFYWYEYVNTEYSLGVYFDERDSFLFGY